MCVRMGGSGSSGGHFADYRYSIGVFNMKIKNYEFI